jgi:hypothetical protein
LTKGLNEAKPYFSELWRETEYPEKAVNEFAGFLSPTAENMAMPAFVVEVKDSLVGLERAQWLCAYDGALMTEGAYTIHTHLNKPDSGFFGKTQAITVAFNSHTLDIFVHYVVHVHNRKSSKIKYYQHHVFSINPWTSLENFQLACQYLRIAQALGYNLALERKNALWAFHAYNSEEEDNNNNSINELQL